MEISQILANALEEKIKNTKISELKDAAQKLSYKYMNQKRTGETFITKDIEAIAYSIIRMPATYGAVVTALKHILEQKEIKVETLLDIGAGTGAATWAAEELISFKQITCIEREKAMQKIGMKLMQNEENLKEAKWISRDIVKEEIIEKADLVIASYMTNELKSEERKNIIKKLVDATNKILLIVEPGTPDGHKIIKEIKKYCTESGLYIIAPCVHQEECQLSQNDWCHATCRVQRTKIHKILKDGDVPYEDEKFSYIAISKEEINTSTSRILRHPIIKTGFVSLDLCTKDGIKTITLSKKDGELYKQAKKKKCGDCFEI